MTHSKQVTILKKKRSIKFLCSTETTQPNGFTFIADSPCICILAQPCSQQVSILLKHSSYMFLSHSLYCISGVLSTGFSGTISITICFSLSRLVKTSSNASIQDVRSAPLPKCLTMSTRLSEWRLDERNSCALARNNFDIFAGLSWFDILCPKRT